MLLVTWFFTKHKSLTNEDGVDVVVEQIGGSILQKSLKCLKKGGRIVVVRDNK